MKHTSCGRPGSGPSAFAPWSVPIRSRATTVVSARIRVLNIGVAGFLRRDLRSSNGQPTRRRTGRRGTVTEEFSVTALSANDAVSHDRCRPRIFRSPIKALWSAPACAARLPWIPRTDAVQATTDRGPISGRRPSAAVLHTRLGTDYEIHRGPPSPVEGREPLSPYLAESALQERPAAEGRSSFPVARSCPYRLRKTTPEGGGLDGIPRRWHAHIPKAVNHFVTDCRPISAALPRNTERQADLCKCSLR